MLQYTETASISTNVTPLEETASSTSPIDLDKCVPLRVGFGHGSYLVSTTLKDGYLAACKAYKHMEEQDEYGPYMFLTGYEYAHLARQHMPTGLSPLNKHEWQRGFVFGWNACILGVKEVSKQALARLAEAVS